MIKKWIKRILGVVAVVLLIIVVIQFDFEELWESVKTIPLWLVILLLIFQIITQVLIVIHWKMSLKYSDMKLSFKEMFYINSQGGVVDSITPGVKFGGELTRAVKIMKKANCSKKEAASAITLQKLFSLASFFIINFFAVIYLIIYAPFFELGLIQIFLITLLIFLIVLFSIIIIFPEKVQKILMKERKSRFSKFSWNKKIKRIFITTLDQAIILRKNKKACITLLIISAFCWLSYPMKMYLLSIQFIPDVNFILVGAIASVAYLAAMIPLLPGGLGGFEGTMTGLLIAVGFAGNDAFVLTVLFRFFTFWFVMLMSLIFIGFVKFFEKWE